MSNKKTYLIAACIFILVVGIVKLVTYVKHTNRLKEDMSLVRTSIKNQIELSQATVRLHQDKIEDIEEIIVSQNAQIAGLNAQIENQASINGLKEINRHYKDVVAELKILNQRLGSLTSDAKKHIEDLETSFDQCKKTLFDLLNHCKYPFLERASRLSHDMDDGIDRDRVDVNQTRQRLSPLSDVWNALLNTSISK